MKGEGDLIEDELHGLHLDVTDYVEEYETGKTFECWCGQGFGTPYTESMWSCPTCHTTIIDKKSEERPINDTKNEQSEDTNEKQSGLDAFM